MRRPPAWAILAALVALGGGLRAWAAARVPVPWIPVDETIYAQLGTSLYRRGVLEVLEGPTPYYSFLYPAFAGIPLTLGGLPAGYVALHALQGVVISLAAVPTYLWALRVAPRRWALAAAALALAPAGLAYAGLVMTEALFYPLLVTAAWASAAALARPSRRTHAAAVALLLVLVATRLQAIVLLPAYVVAAGLLALFERRREALLRVAPAAGALGLAALGWVAWRVAAGKPLLGAYEAAAGGGYDAGRALRFVVAHAGDLVLLSLVVPACALALLALEAARGRERSRELRAALAVTLAFSLAFVLQVGLFASAHVGYVAERNLFSLAPLLLVCLAAWLGRGAPRPRLATAAVALGSLALVLAVRLDEYAVEAALPFSLTPVAVWRHLGAAAAWQRELVVYGTAALAAAAFALVPRRALWALPALVAAALAGGSAEASRYVVDVTRLQQARFLGAERRWVDAATDARTAYLYDGDRDWDAVWENIFWNRRIRRVYDLPATRIVGPLPQATADVEPDGTLVASDGEPLPERSLVASSNLTLAGTRVAQARQQLPGQAGLVLWRLAGTPRVLTRAGGLAPNGDVVANEASLVAYDCTAEGRLRVSLVVKEAGTVEIARDERVWRRLSFAGPATWGAEVPAAPLPGERFCRFTIATTGLVGVTVLEYLRD